MIRIFDIASKDLLQLLRDRKIFMFLLIMPIAFTLLFGFASGAFSRSTTDPRLPVGFLDEDHSRLSRSLHDLLAASEVIRLEQGKASTTADLENLVTGEKLAAAIIVPSGYGHKVLDGKPAKLTLIADTGATAGISVESEALAAAIHLDSAVRMAMIMEQVMGDTPDLCQVCCACELA